MSGVLKLRKIAVNSVQKLQSKLMYENCHYECVLRMKDEEIVKLREELLAARQKGKLDPHIVADREDQLKSEIYLQKQRIEAAEENENNAKKDQEFFKQKFQKAQEQLAEAHRLVKVHLHTAADYRDESRKLQTEKEECEKKFDETENRLRDVHKQLNDLHIKHADDTKAWESQTREFENKIRQVTADIERQSEIIDDKEIQVKEKAKLIDTLNEELNCAKAILNVEKDHEECQTILQMLDTCDSGAQVEPDTRNKESQTAVKVMSQSSQTTNPATKNSGIQTIVVEVIEDEVQTEAGNPQDDCTQTAKQGTRTKTTQTDIIYKYKESMDPGNDRWYPKHDKLEQVKSGGKSVISGIFQTLHTLAADDIRQHEKSMNEAEIICQPKDNQILQKQVNHQEVEQYRNEAVSNEELPPDLSDGHRTVSMRTDDVFSTNVNEKNSKIGISVPKLNLHKDLLVAEHVVVDPDEFNVCLTQDEIVTDDSNKKLDTYAAFANIADNTKDIGYDAPPSDHFIEVPNTSSVNSMNEIRNTGQYDRRIIRPKNQKLTSKDVENYFSEFEERGRIFKSVTKRPASPNESQAKLVKLSDYNQELHPVIETSKYPLSDETSDEMLAFGTNKKSLYTLKLADNLVNRDISLASFSVREGKKPLHTSNSANSIETCGSIVQSNTAEQGFQSKRLSEETLMAAKGTDATPSTLLIHGPGKNTSKFKTQPPTMTAFDIMQRYKDTVAKVRPMQGQNRAGKQPEGTMSANGWSNVVVTSPRVGTVRGILKFGRNVHQHILIKRRTLCPADEVVNEHMGQRKTIKEEAVMYPGVKR